MTKPLSGAAAQFAAMKYGGPVSAVQTVQSIGNTVENVFGPNADRLGYALINLSTDLIYVGFDELTSVTRGIFLAANGGSLTLDAETDLVLVTYPIFAISTGTASNLFYTVTRRYSAGTPGEFIDAS